jgi:aminoglycoside phosphotransferase (APT) family kinase protein
MGAASEELAADRTAERAQELLRTLVPEGAGLVLGECVKIASGVSHDTYLLNAHKSSSQDDTANPEFVLRVAPTSGTQPSLDIETQYGLLKELAEKGVPVPRVYGWDSGKAFGDRPCVLMERVKGESYVTWQSFGEKKGQETLDAVRRQFVAVLANIHALDWRTLNLPNFHPPKNAHDYALKELKHWRSKLTKRDEEEHPILRQAALWLSRNAPRCNHPIVIVHGDYRLNNIIVKDSVIRAILDWEVAGLGDPIADLGMAAMSVWGRGFFTRQELLREYKTVTGLSASVEELCYWEALNYFKTIAATFGFMRAFRKGEIHDLRVGLSGILLSSFFTDLARLMEGRPW